MSKKQEFIDHVRSELKQAGGTLRLANTKNVLADGLCCSGYFDSEVPNISVAINKPEEIWLSTLCHEFSHFQQWQSDSAAWRNTLLPDGRDGGNVFEEWLDGEEHDLELVKDSIARYRRLELDCERRCVKNLTKFQLPIDIGVYCQRANAYIHFYNFIFERRRWYKRGKPPYASPAIMKVMPKTMDGRYDRTPKWLIDLFDIHC